MIFVTQQLLTRKHNTQQDFLTHNSHEKQFIHLFLLQVKYMLHTFGKMAYMKAAAAKN